MRTTTGFRSALIAGTALGALGLIGLSSAMAAEAEAAVVDAVTVTATRSEKKADEVPATVSVIGARQIEDELATDIKDLIRFEACVSVRNSPARFTDMCEELLEPIIADADAVLALSRSLGSALAAGGWPLPIRRGGSPAPHASPPPQARQPGSTLH